MGDQPVGQPSAGDELQFDHVEHQEAAEAGASCSACQQAIVGEYYEVNGKAVCGVCCQGITAAFTGGSRLKRLVKATVLGVLGGVVGAGIYFAVLALTQYEVALIAIVVGIVVGCAVRAGSENRGGWLYQALAIGITYCAIVATYVPMIVKGFEENQDQALRAATSTVAPASAPVGGPGRAGTNETVAAQPTEVVRVPKVFMYAFAFVLAFISPVLYFDPIGYLIKGFALYEAWKINKRRKVAISGPYRLAVEAEAGATAGGTTS